MKTNFKSKGMRLISFVIVLLNKYFVVIFLLLGCKAHNNERDTSASSINLEATEADMKSYRQVDGLEWEEVFFDSCTKDWKKQWTIDGLKASVNNTNDGMDFFAGPVAKEDASHAVLWTKNVFKGDVRIDYEFTKLDEKIEAVNIIYIQASGSGSKGFDHDIIKWSAKREIPSMKLYFNHMNTYHISYAAFDLLNQDSKNDYIKLRRYMPEKNEGGLVGTDFDPVYSRTGLFKKGIPHKISIIKKGTQIYMYIKNPEKEMLCQWNVKDLPIIEEGRIGLRHMWTRGSRYRDFRVSRLRAD